MNTSAVRELFLAILRKDMTSQLNNKAIYDELVEKGKQLAAEAIRIGHDIANGIYLEGIEILSSVSGSEIRNRLTALAGLCDKLPSYASPAKMRNLPWTADDIKRVTAVRKDMDDIKQTMHFVEDFRSRLSYLNQAKQYMTDDNMKQRVDDAFRRLNDVIAKMNDEPTVSAYRTELDALMGDYADWYLSEYSRLHITALQDTEKRKILNSNESRVCEAICGADHDKGYFAVSAQYAEWTRKMAQLTVSSNSVSRDSVLRTPYQGFNPVQFAGKQLPRLADLNEELSTIYNNVDESLHQILKDETLLTNKDILTDSEQGLLQRFNTGAEELSPMNAERLVEIVSKLHQGINKIATSVEALRTVFNRPMTPDDAIKAFRQHIINITGGSKDANIRIILK